MLTIDGSHGEGGGQILRYAIALSVFSKKDVLIKNIRAKRPKPGLRPQHLTAISCMKTLCNANVEGLFIGSSNLLFKPKDITTGYYNFDIGTAGSITLIFQACILSALKSKSIINIKIKGGTDVKWSPSWAYFTNVFLPIICSMGIKIDFELIKRGYYPKGGGEALIKIHTIKNINSIKLENNNYFDNISGIIHVSNLPEHIVKRIKHSAIQQAVKNNLQISIRIDESPALSPGVGVTIWSKSGFSILGSCFLGEIGIPAEKIGIDAVNLLIEEIKSKATIDSYAFDQILPYMVIAKDTSICHVKKLSNHSNTAIWLLKQFFDFKIDISRHENSIFIKVN